MGQEALAASIGGAVGGVIGGFFGGVGAVPGAAAGTATATAIYAVLGPRIERAINEIGPEMMQHAFESMGLDLEGGVSDATITAAINKAFLSGHEVQLTSVLDSEKMMQGFTSFGLAKVGESLDLPKTGSEASIVAALQGWITEETIIQMGHQAGEIFDAAKERAALKKQIAALPKPAGGWNDPVDMTEHGFKNRAAQKKYRDSHTKHWVARA